MRLIASPPASGQVAATAITGVRRTRPARKRDMPTIAAPECGRKTGQHRNVIGDEQGAGFVHPHAAEFFRRGVSTAVKPSSAALRNMPAIAPGSLASSAATAGTISSRAKRAAVAAIWRCSSFRSSGVKTSAGVRSSTKKLPPEAATMEEIDKAGMEDVPLRLRFKGTDSGGWRAGQGEEGNASQQVSELAEVSYPFQVETVKRMGQPGSSAPL